AGGIIQLASAAFPAWELPNWTLRLVIVLLLIGFPIALIFAWVFDVTPEGIRATEPVPSVPSHRRGRRNVALLIAAGIIISATAGFFLLPRISSARKVDKSIAVLPFENLSDDKENAYFADGIQDDILTNLAHLSDLKVVSRTSVMSYRGKPSSVREIGKALGVSAILEGTVRKSGNRVRLNVQLINAENDEHLWAHRDLTDVFAIQTDLAQKIADELQAKLSPTEKAQLMRKPTENNEAYLAFVQARDLQSHLEDISKLQQAEQLYDRVLQLDANFALAHAGYSRLQSWILHTFDPSPARRDKARQHATRALQLQPDLPEGHLALGFSYYYGDTDFDAALREFEIAQKGLPNANEVYLALGAIQRRQGRWAESSANLEKAATLNPKDSWALQNLAINYEMVRDFDKARATLDRALKIDPKSFSLWEIKAKVELEATGDFSVAEEALTMIEQMPRTNDSWYLLCAARGGVRLLQRKYSEALAAAESAPDESLMQKSEVLPSKYMVMGSAYKGLKNEAGAREAFTKARDFAQQRVNAAPSDPDGYALLASALALLGEKDAALSAMQRALELLPVSKDAFHGPDILEIAAEVYAVVGETDRAFQTLDELSKIPSPVSAELLKLNPIWDSIRNDPRFEQLLPKFSAKL
ncbi:MAG: tetratricopeptide repeat protein, partial [Chthoniobacterales bacterium]